MVCFLIGFAMIGTYFILGTKPSWAVEESHAKWELEIFHVEEGVEAQHKVLIEAEVIEVYDEYARVRVTTPEGTEYVDWYYDRPRGGLLEIFYLPISGLENLKENFEQVKQEIEEAGYTLTKEVVKAKVGRVWCYVIRFEVLEFGGITAKGFIAFDMNSGLIVLSQAELTGLSEASYRLELYETNVPLAYEVPPHRRALFWGGIGFICLGFMAISLTVRKEIKIVGRRGR
jgi:hypothetical protein